MGVKGQLHFLEDKWNESAAAKLDKPELLWYRSNSHCESRSHHQPHRDL